MVARVCGVDRDDGDMGKIFALAEREFRNALRLGQNPVRKGVRNAVLVDGDEAEAARSERIAEDGIDPRRHARRSSRDFAQHQVARLRDHGRTSKYEHAEVGWGERLDALQAAVLRVKLARLEDGNAARERLAGRYDEALGGVGDLVPPPRVEGRTSARHLHVVRTRHRDELLATCRAAGVGAGIHYPVPLHLQPAWRHLGLTLGDLPTTEAWAAECLSLPVHPSLGADDLERIVTAVNALAAAGA